jgi:hypothetical protein
MTKLTETTPLPPDTPVYANHPSLPRLAEAIDWVNAGKFVLEKNDCSRLHILTEALLTKHFVRYSGNGKTWITHTLDADDPMRHIAHTFVVRHDWAGAFNGAVEVADEYKLPFDKCAFEFRISGWSVIAVANEGGVTVFVQSGDYWVLLDAEHAHDDLIDFIQTQIQAICVALDAEVATHTVVRAPAKLNEKRISKGRRPISDYYVVDLAKRHRIANPSAGAGGGGKKRLHFRRGHWRHYEESKTWVKWCLVGDPDLGFVNKHYSL